MRRSRRLINVAATISTALILFGGAQATAKDSAPKPPLVWSGKAMLFAGSTTLILQGWVKPRGQVTACHFQLGRTTSYGMSRYTEPEPHGYRNHPIGEAVTGLKPRTTYHFRLVCHSRGGTTHGKDKTFTTLDPGHS
jgi:hypothetical protein